MLKVSEQFYSIQGEGKSMGVPAYFLRLKSCNLLCGGIGTDKDGLLHDGATWRCDTIEVWLKGQEFNAEDVAFSYMTSSRNTRLIITGGEPLLQQREIIKMLGIIPLDRIIEIETNGTIMPDLYLLNRVQWNVSPKLANSGMAVDKRIHLALLRKLADYNTQYKFVVSSHEDVKEVFNTYVNPGHLPLAKVWLMPAAENQTQLNEVAPRVVEWAKAYGVNFSNRLHIQIWNKKTGV